MEHSDFQLGLEFWCGGKRWRCTDVGSRTIVAICLEPQPIKTVAGLELDPGESDASGTRGRAHPQEITDESWFAGPPYMVAEVVFDENDLPGCEPKIEGEES